MSSEIEQNGEKIEIKTNNSTMEIVSDKELKTKVTEHYKLWVLVRLHYEDLDNYSDDKKYVDYETLLKTPCSSMFKFPLKQDDLDNALSEMFDNDLIEVRVKTQDIEPLHHISENDNLKDEFNDLAPDEKMLFKLSINGNLKMLYELNQVLKYDSYEEALGKLDATNITLKSFLKKTIEKITEGEDLDTIKKECLKIFLTSFNMFIKLKELFQ